MRLLSRQRCSPGGLAGFRVLSPARRTQVRLRGEVLRKPPQPAGFRSAGGRERSRVCHPNEFASLPPSPRVRPRSPRRRSRRPPGDPLRVTSSADAPSRPACVSSRRSGEPRLRVSLRQPLRLSSAREHALCAAVAAYRWPAQEGTRPGRQTRPSWREKVGDRTRLRPAAQDCDPKTDSCLSSGRKDESLAQARR